MCRLAGNGLNRFAFKCALFQYSLLQCVAVEKVFIFGTDIGFNLDCIQKIVYRSVLAICIALFDSRR